MKTLTAILMLFCSGLASAQECGEPDGKHWNTEVKLLLTPVTLHWTTVYEGVDTVCEVSYIRNPGQPQALEVYGQPQINEKQNLLGFVTCADDGCEKQIHIADINRDLVVIAELPIDASQFYLKAKWKGSSREYLIEVESFSNGKALPPSRILCSVSENARCSRVL